ncbi:putative sulfate/molybdate transporter [Planctomycetota bacterium]|nr:putative sulfate/molybdate transporter [Planctomycetota bacterium]
MIDDNTPLPFKHYRFDLQEFSGSLGDLGTFLPLALALSVFCGMEITVIFLFAGLMNIATGLFFKQPIPVQPMKAIAAVAIAEGFGTGEIASAGLFMGLFVIILSISGSIDWLSKQIPKSLVRGIQLGIGIKLAYKGIVWIWPIPFLQLDSWLTAILAAVLIWGVKTKRFPILAIIVPIGLIIAFIKHGNLLANYNWQWPNLNFVIPNNHQWWDGLIHGALPQLPLTLLNSVIAVCALSHDYFPKQGIKPKKMALSVGLMNLIAVPFGGMPMCHGSGGLAAQYRFGSRTGGSVIMLGTIKIAAALILCSTLGVIVQAYPISILAVTLIFAGFLLASTAKDCMHKNSIFIVLITASVIVFFSTFWGFLLGTIAYLIQVLVFQSKEVNHE